MNNILVHFKHPSVTMPRLAPTARFLLAIPPLWLAGELGLGRPVMRLAIRILKDDPVQLGHRKFANYRPAAHDVIVSTYAKSGTNWMLQIAHQIAHRGAGEYEHIHDVVPWPDALIPFKDCLLSEGDRRVGPTGMRVIKTHLAEPDVMYNADARYIVVLRDPKDVFVSSYHFAHGVMAGVMKVRFTPTEWLEMFTSGTFFFGPWAEHTAKWWRLRDRENVLVMTFDELKRDLPGGVRRVSDFMGVELTPEELAAVIERSGFSYMKDREKAFTPTAIRVRDYRATMIRNGRSGGAGELIDAEQQATIDRFCQDELREMESDFPYTEIFDTAPSRAQATG